MAGILILSSTFYPDPTVAAIRVTEWAKHFRDSGDEVTVICRQYLTQQQLKAEVPLEGITVHRLGTAKKESGCSSGLGKGPASIVGSPTRARACLRRAATEVAKAVSIPDVAIWAQRKLFSEVARLSEEAQPDVVISSSPPHSIHWMGQRVSKRLDIPWIADFRDPFTIDRRFVSKRVNVVTRCLTRRFELSLYRHASLTTHAISIHFRWVRRNCNDRKAEPKLLMNGVPDELSLEHREGDARNISPDGPVTLFSSSTLEHEVLLGLAEGFEAVHPERSLLIRFSGNPPLELPKDSERVKYQFLGRVSHERAIEETKHADILVGSLSDDNSAGIGLSSKLFEYLATASPVIHINPTRSDRVFLRRFPHVAVISNPNELDFENAFKAIKSVSRNNLRSVSQAFIERFRRRKQCERLRSWIDELVEPSSQNVPS